MTLELFKKDSCPYCQRVMNYIADKGRQDIIYHDIIRDKDAAHRLVAVGGIRQVPCLFIDGEPMYESLDIIQWLEEN